MFNFLKRICCVAFLGFLLVFLTPQIATAVGIEGKPCFEINATRVDSGIHYYCFPIHGEGLYWWRDYVLSPTNKINPSQIVDAKLKIGIQNSLIENCDNLPADIKKYKFKKIGKGPSSGGNPGTIYSLGTFKVVVYDAKELGYNFGPFGKADYKKANQWRCPWSLFIEK